MPRQDLEYELRLLAPPVTMKAQLQKVVALIRENKRIKLVHGPRERECCHGWIRASQEEEIAQILCELDQLRLVSTNGNPQDTQKKQAKVMATVLCLETIGTAEIERDKSVLQQTHALDNEVGGFISAAFDTRNLLTERGLVGLLEWKVVCVFLTLPPKSQMILTPLVHQPCLTLDSWKSNSFGTFWSQTTQQHCV